MEGAGSSALSTRDEPRARGLGRAASPFALMTQLSQEMDRLFGGFGGPWSAPISGSRFADDERWWSPAIEVEEREGELVVRADLPGTKREDIHVDLDGDLLTIRGERKQACEEDGGRFRSECRYGSFLRAFTLPRAVDPEAIRATFEGGVLEVRVPTPEEERRRRSIEIGDRGAIRTGGGAGDARTIGERGVR